jgi:hypothetical protein
MTHHKRVRRDSDAERRITTVQEILRRWDPIGLQPGTNGPPDEYDGYAARLVALVSGGCSIDELCRYLETLCSVSMGVEADIDRDHAIAAEIVNALRTTTP